jgi:hypothetical protein
VVKILATAVGQEKIKEIQIGNEEFKLSIMTSGT